MRVCSAVVSCVAIAERSLGLPDRELRIVVADRPIIEHDVEVVRDAAGIHRAMIPQESCA
jgi:hypothetical protein